MVQARVGNRREQALAVRHQPAHENDGPGEQIETTHASHTALLLPQNPLSSCQPAAHLTQACNTAEIMRGPPLAPMASTRLPLRSTISGLMLLNGFLRGLGSKSGAANAT